MSRFQRPSVAAPKTPRIALGVASISFALLATLAVHAQPTHRKTHHESDPLKPVHEYIAGQAWNLLPSGEMKNEFALYVGNLVTYDIHGRRVTTYSGRYNEDVNLNGVLDPGEDVNGNGQLDVDIQERDGWLPDSHRPEVPFSRFDSAQWEASDFKQDGDSPPDNATIGAAAAGGDDIIEGIMEEDYFAASNPDNYGDVFYNGDTEHLLGDNAACMFQNHLWIRNAHDGTHESPLQATTTCGTQTAVVQPAMANRGLADIYWQMAIDDYRRGNTCVFPGHTLGRCLTWRALGYYYLGRVSHLLTDMTVPAHALGDNHGDDLYGGLDSYEKKYLGVQARYTQYAFNHTADASWSYAIGDIAYDSFAAVTTGPDFGTSATRWTGTEQSWRAQSLLYRLFWYTAEVADNYSSDGLDGEIHEPLLRVDDPDTTFTWAKDLSNEDLKRNADALMPLAMKVTAELYALFWDATHQPGVIGVSFSGQKSGNISITFDERLNDATITNATLIVRGSSSGTHAWQKTYADSRRELTIDPTLDFVDGETVTVSLLSGITDRFGNAVVPNDVTFTTAAARLTVSRTTIDLFGMSQAVSSPLTITNNGSVPLFFAISGDGNGISLSANAGTLGGGESQKIDVTASPTVGTTQRKLTVSGAGASIDVIVSTRFTTYTPSTTTLYATADTYISSTSPDNTGFGTSSSLIIRGGNSPSHGLVRFDTTSFKQVGVRSATLSFYKETTTAQQGTLTIRSVTQSWSESSTWNTLRSGNVAIGNAYALMTIPTGTGYFSVDLTGFVNVLSRDGGNGLLLMIQDASGISLVISSDETARGARLDLVTLRPGCDLTGALNVTPTASRFYQGTTIGVDMLYRNAGSGDCGQTINYLYFETAAGNQIDYGSGTTEVLFSGESGESRGDRDLWQVTLSQPPGEYRFHYRIDEPNWISDTNRGNNEIYSYFSIVPAPAIGLQPPSMAFDLVQGEQGHADLTVSSTAAGSDPVSWTASADQPWITLSRTSGLSTDSSPATITIYANTAGLSPGVYSSTITFAGNAPAAYSISLSVRPIPAKLSVHRIVTDRPSGVVTDIRKGETLEFVAYAIENLGTADMSWSATITSPPGITVTSSSSSSGVPATLKVSATPGAILANTSASVSITINCATGCSDTFEDRVTLTVRPPEIALSEIATSVPSYIELWNRGGAPVNIGGWTVDVNTNGGRTVRTLPSFSLAPRSGVLLTDSSQAPGAQINIGSNFRWFSGADGAVALLDPDGVVVDYVPFGQRIISRPSGALWSGLAAASPAPGYVLGRSPERSDSDSRSDWCEQRPSPGWRNMVCDGYALTILADQPAAYYRLDEADGTTAWDASGNGRHATYSDATNRDYTGIGAGSSCRFETPLSYVQLPGTWGGTAELSVEAWIYVVNTLHYPQAIVGSTSQAFVQFEANDGGGPTLNTDTGSYFVGALPQSPTAQWRHVVLTARSGDVRLYIDGSQVSSSSPTFGSITSSSAVEIGRGYFGTQFFHGMIDEVAIYSYAMPFDRVQKHYLAASAPSGLDARARASSQVSLYWTAVPRAVSYEIARNTVSTDVFVPIGLSSSNSFFDNNVIAGRTYAYRVRAVDAAGVLSAYSSTDIATTIVFTDDPLVPGQSTVRLQHLGELFAAVNSVRAYAGLTALTVPPSPRAILGSDIRLLRSALDEALRKAGLTPPSFGEPIVDRVTPVRAVHFAEIRRQTN